MDPSPLSISPCTTPGEALLEEVEVEVADVFGSKLIGGAAEMGDEAQDTREVGLDGIGGIVTDLEVLEKALPQGSHGGTRRR